jgi:tetratricopeptide (TPR) repeat protein
LIVCPLPPTQLKIRRDSDSDDYRSRDADESDEEAINLDKKWKLPWFNKGISLDNLGQYQKAIKCYDEVMPDLRALLLTDIDNQFVSPLSVIRKAVSFPTKVLRNNNVPEVIRDEFAIRNFPTDVYDLSPASFGDLNAELQELGIVNRIGACSLSNYYSELDSSENGCH